MIFFYSHCLLLVAFVLAIFWLSSSVAYCECGSFSKIHFLFFCAYQLLWCHAIFMVLSISVLVVFVISVHYRPRSIVVVVVVYFLSLNVWAKLNNHTTWDQKKECSDKALYAMTCNKIINFTVNIFTDVKSLQFWS